MKFKADPERTRYDYWFAEDIARMLEFAMSAMEANNLNGAQTLTVLANRFHIDIIPERTAGYLEAER